MTVCVAAICEGGNAVIVASDRMVTGSYPPAEFEHTRPKISQLTPTCLILNAGNALKPVEIIPKAKESIDGSQDKSEIRHVVKKVRDAYQFVRAGEAEKLIFRPRTLSTEVFYTRGAQILPRDLFNVLDHEFANYSIDTEFLIAGVDLNAHIFSITNPGIINCYDDMGFHSIGVGNLHAFQTFISHQYTTSCSVDESISVVYAAKKAAEVAPGVGIKTDMGIILRDKIIMIDDEIKTKLSEIYRKFHRSPTELTREATKELRHFIKDREQSADNEPKVAQNEQKEKTKDE